MTGQEIIAALALLSVKPGLVVITGGEPALQLTEDLVELMHEQGYEIALETNGTKELPCSLDWVAVSPKESFVGEKGKPILKVANELKVVFDDEHEVTDYGIQADFYYLQPCDTGNEIRNRRILQRCVEYILKHPKWQLSLQTHKIIHIR